jgi:hypothetical protein
MIRPYLQSVVLVLLLSAAFCVPVGWNRLLSTPLARLLGRPRPSEVGPLATNFLSPVAIGPFSQVESIVTIANQPALDSQSESASQNGRGFIDAPPREHSLATTAATARAREDLERRDRQTAALDLQRILDRGGDWVRAGAAAPELVAEFSVLDIQNLLNVGLGLIVGEVQGRFYQVVCWPGRSFLDADQFVPLTPETRRFISNRGLRLDRARNDLGTQQATALGTLGQRLQAMSGPGQGASSALYFFPSAAFDVELRRKQLGVLQELGVGFGAQPKADVTTIGVLTAKGRTPAYLIHSVRYDGRTYRFLDPETRLVSQ